MARHKTPTNILELRGSFDKNPQRKRLKEPKPKGKLGTPPRHFDKEQKAAWRELVKIMPDGVAFDSDRWAVEVTVRLMVELRNAGSVSAAKISRLETLLARLGLTPADRSKVQVHDGKDKQADPWDEL
ncbi:MAG: hypothetical protein ABW140_01520 [Candidatus Sedimenticola sp. 6PFRAG1]